MSLATLLPFAIQGSVVLIVFALGLDARAGCLEPVPAVSVLPVLFTAWPAIVSRIGNGTILAIAAFVLIGLAIGQALGGPEPDDRTVLALCTATRHPGIAMAIAHANFPDEKLVPAAVILYFIVSAILTIPYVTWRRRRHSEVSALAGT
jgi:bile acid:Na+ symporter, BASS family